MPVICGVRDGDGVSDFYKARLSQDIAGVGHVTVVGYVSDETTVELSQLWNSPFQDDTAGNAGGFSKAAGLAQTEFGKTTTTLLNSKLVWEGAEALEFSLPLHFAAYADAQKEVDDPIKYFMMMASPELENIKPIGQRPLLVTLDLGRKIKTDVYIRSVQYDTNAPRTKTGCFAHNSVTLQCVLDGAINASKIPDYFK